MVNQSDHYFLAISLPVEVRQTLSNHANVLKEKLPYKQWTHPEDYHITLAFLGSAGFQKINDLKQSVMKKVFGHPTFSMELSGLGTFGQKERPRVIWAGIAADDHLFHLQKQIHCAVYSEGFKLEERPYRPHITLAKKWIGTDHLDRRILETGIERLSWKINEVILYRTLMGRNPKYQPLKTFRF